MTTSEDNSKNSGGFWSSPWTLAIVPSLLVAVVQFLAEQFPTAALRIIIIVGAAALIIGGLGLLLALAEQSAAISLALGRLLWAVYGFVIGGVVGQGIEGFVSPPAFPSFAPSPPISVFQPPVGEGFGLWLAWAAPIIGAFAGALIKAKKQD